MRSDVGGEEPIEVATSRSVVGPNQLNPALLTRTSMNRPARQGCLGGRGHSRSAATKRALPPAEVMDLTTASPWAQSLPVHDDFGAVRPSSSATVLPMPEVAPVTRALRPLEVLLSVHGGPFRA